MRTFFDSVSELEFDLIRIGEVFERDGLFEEWDSQVDKLIGNIHLYKLGTLIRKEEDLDLGTAGKWYRPDFSNIPCTFKEFVGKGWEIKEYAYSMRLDEVLNGGSFKPHLIAYFQSPMRYERQWADHLEKVFKEDHKETVIADLRKPEDIKFSCHMDYKTTKLVIKIQVPHKIWVAKRSRFKRKRKIIL